MLSICTLHISVQVLYGSLKVRKGQRDYPANSGRAQDRNFRLM